VKRLLICLLSCVYSIIISAQSKPLIEWADIPSGTFYMGTPVNEDYRSDDETQHKVTLSAFKMSKYEITVSQFKAFVDATGYVTDADKSTGGISGSLTTSEIYDFKLKHMVKQYIRLKNANWSCDVYGNKRPKEEYNHPVVHVSWNDANAFAEWMGCRLPTEAEWEYSCRAGTTTPYYTGDSITTSQANFNGKFKRRTFPVGSFSPNPWGLYDMHGNVSEWCEDWYGIYPNEEQTNPKGPSVGTKKVIRGSSLGASWGTSAFRSKNPPEFRIYFCGFRIVSDK